MVMLLTTGNMLNYYVLFNTFAQFRQVVSYTNTHQMSFVPLTIYVT